MEEIHYFVVVWVWRGEGVKELQLLKIGESRVAFLFMLFWTSFQPFLHSGKSKQVNDILLKKEDHLVTNKQFIANIFNKYLVNIASNIKEPVRSCNANFEDHLSISTILCLQEIKVNKGCCYDNITHGRLLLSYQVGVQVMLIDIKFMFC